MLSAPSGLGRPCSQNPVFLQPRSPGQIVSPLLKQVAMILNPVIKAAPALIEPLYVMAQVKYLSGEPRHPPWSMGPQPEHSGRPYSYPHTSSCMIFTSSHLGLHTCSHTHPQSALTLTQHTHNTHFHMLTYTMPDKTFYASCFSLGPRSPADNCPPKL